MFEFTQGDSIELAVRPTEGKPEEIIATATVIEAPAIGVIVDLPDDEYEAIEDGAVVTLDGDDFIMKLLGDGLIFMRPANLPEPTDEELEEAVKRKKIKRMTPSQRRKERMRGRRRKAYMKRYRKKPSTKRKQKRHKQRIKGRKRRKATKRRREIFVTSGVDGIPWFLRDAVDVLGEASVSVRDEGEMMDAARDLFQHEGPFTVSDFSEWTGSMNWSGIQKMLDKLVDDGKLEKSRGQYTVSVEMA